MSGAVGVKSFLGQGRAFDRCRLNAPRQDVTETEPGEPLSSLVAEERRIRSHVQLRFLGKLLQYLRRLRPKRADSPLASLAKQSHLRWCVELQVAGVQVDNLLGSCTGVKEHGE
jgi:hypothetical protein